MVRIAYFNSARAAAQYYRQAAGRLRVTPNIELRAMAKAGGGRPRSGRTSMRSAIIVACGLLPWGVLPTAVAALVAWKCL